jgi:prepilin signal peptidase PulO-like enzyme (type II secretory pathway)
VAEQIPDSDPKAGIGRNQPLRLSVAVAMVAIWVADLLVHHSHVEKVLGFVLIAVLARITVTDIEERRIPDRVTVPASAVALLIGLLMHTSGLPAQVLAGLATGVGLFVVALVSRGGLGMGDVKLGLVLGLFLSRYVVVALIAGVIASAIFSLGVLAKQGLSAGLRTKIAMGPFLAIGGVVAVLAGPRFF